MWFRWFGIAGCAAIVLTQSTSTSWAQKKAKEVTQKDIEQVVNQEVRRSPAEIFSKMKPSQGGHFEKRPDNRGSISPNPSPAEREMPHVVTHPNSLRLVREAPMVDVFVPDPPSPPTTCEVPQKTASPAKSSPSPEPKSAAKTPAARPSPEPKSAPATPSPAPKK